MVHLLPHCKHKFWVALPITDWVIQLLNNQFQSFSLSLQSHHLLCLKSSRFLVSPSSSESQFLPVSGEVVWGGDSHQLWESQASNTTGSLASLSLLTCLRKWYLSVPSWDIKKLLLFKGTLCRQSPVLYPGRRGELSPWQCSEIHSTSVLRPHFTILSVVVHAGQIPAAHCKLS